MKMHWTNLRQTFLGQIIFFFFLFEQEAEKINILISRFL